MSTCGQYEKYIYVWLHRIRTKMIQAPGRPPLIMLHHPPPIEASTRLNKNSYSSKNCTQFDSLPSDLLRHIDMWHVVLVHCNKLKTLLAQFIQHHPVLHESTTYKLKYAPFDYYMHYNIIRY